MSEITDESSLDDINIRHFKLSSGDEVIGMVIDPREVDDEEGSISEDGLIVLNRPMRIDIVEESDQTMFLFHEWQPISKYSYCLLNPVHVVSHTECDEGTKHRYIQICVSHSSLNTSDDGDDDEFYYTSSGALDRETSDGNDTTKDVMVNPSNGNPSGKLH